MPLQDKTPAQAEVATKVDPSWLTKIPIKALIRTKVIAGSFSNQITASTQELMCQQKLAKQE